jgi:hypothetical protein
MGLDKNMPIFDNSFCTLMDTHEEYKKLSLNHYDTYRDLNKVWQSDYCLEHGFGGHNTLLVNSDSIKVQLFVNNSMCVYPYSYMEVESGYLTRVCDFILKAAAAGDIPNVLN